MPEWAAVALVGVAATTGGGIVRLLWSINAKLAGLAVTVADHDKSISDLERQIWPGRRGSDRR